MPSVNLLLPGIPVVDSDENAAVDSRRDLSHVALCEQRRLDSLSALGMHAVAIEELQRLGRCRMPRLKQSPILFRDAQFALVAEDFNWQRIEKLVGKDDDWNFAP